MTHNRNVTDSLANYMPEVVITFQVMLPKGGRAGSTFVVVSFFVLPTPRAFLRERSSEHIPNAVSYMFFRTRNIFPFSVSWI